MTEAKNVGEIDADEEVVTLDISGAGAVAVQLAGTFTGTLQFEASVDGGTFVALSMIPSSSASGEAAADVTSATAAGAWSGSCGGYRIFRVRASDWTSGTARVAIGSAASGGK